MMKTSEHPIPVTRTWFHPCKAPMLWTTWVPVISLRGLRSFFGAEGCIAFFLGCPAGQDRTLLSQCRIELLAVCKTKIVRDRKLTKISKLNRPESGRAYWNENFSVWKSRTLSSSLCLRAPKFWKHPCHTSRGSRCWVGQPPLHDGLPGR